MPNNVEIKAKCNYDELYHLASKYAEFTAVLRQVDTFYPCKEKGFRLKIREITDESGNLQKGELIYYSRPDQSGPKTSTFEIEVLADYAAVKKKHVELTMAETHGKPTKIVQKVRTLFMLGRTRIHIDRVANLGDFMELEVCLKEGESAKIGEEEARDIMQKLNIKQSSLIEGAYADMLPNLSEEEQNLVISKYQ